MTLVGARGTTTGPLLFGKLIDSASASGDITGIAPGYFLSDMTREFTEQNPDLKDLQRLSDAERHLVSRLVGAPHTWHAAR